MRSVYISKTFIIIRCFPKKKKHLYKLSLKKKKEKKMAKIKILQTKRILGWGGVRWMIDSPLVKKRRPRTKCLHLTFSDTWQVYFEPRNAHQRVGCKETPCLPFLTVGKWRAFQMAMHACIACAWRCMHGDGGESVNAT